MTSHQTTLFGQRIILNIHEARDLLIDFLRRKGYSVVKVLPSNFGRHYIIYVRDPVLSEIRRYYLIYQRRWFESFQKYFGIPEEVATVNLSILHRIVLHEIPYIVWCNMEGKLFMIPSKKAWKIVRKNKWIRKTEKTGEITAHIPLSKLIKLV